MKINKWLVIALVLIGTAVGLISIYMASLTGVMGKMGLVGGDFSQDIDKNELARQIRDKEENDCGVVATLKNLPRYLLSEGELRVVLAFELGQQRVMCGIGLVQRGNIERGVYSIIKGLYYLKIQYNEIQQLVRKDNTNCMLLTKTDYEEWVQGYLNATKGRIHDIVFDLYKQVEIERSGVDELCTQ
jgi:hypothetical protein